MKVCVVVSEITSPAFAAAAPFPVFNSIFLLRWAIEFEFRTLNGVRSRRKQIRTQPERRKPALSLV
jgi:hypothetical protein